MGPLAAAPGSLSYSRASRGSSGPTGTHVQAPAHLGGFPGEAPSRGEGAWVGRAWRGRCPGSPTRAAAFRREPPHAPPRYRIPGTVTCGRGRPVRRTPLPPALLNSHRRGSRQSGSLPPRPIKAASGAAALGDRGAERSELFPAGAERRPAEAGPSPPAPMGEHLLPCALVGARPAGPRRQPRSSPSPDPKPLSRGDETLPSPNVRGSGRGPLRSEASLPASPELLPSNLWQL